MSKTYNLGRITGKSAYESYVATTTDETILSEKEWVESLKGEKGDKGDKGDDSDVDLTEYAKTEDVENVVAQYVADNNIGSVSSDDITTAVNTYLETNPVTSGVAEEDIKYIAGAHTSLCGTYQSGYYNASGVHIEGSVLDVNCLQYEFIEYDKYIRVRASIYNNAIPLYVFLDDSDNVLEGVEMSVDTALYDGIWYKIPDGAVKICVNGASTSAMLEVMSWGQRGYGVNVTDRAINALQNKLSTYAKQFAWKPFDTGKFIFTFDDTISDIGLAYRDFKDMGVTCAYGTILENVGKSYKYYPNANDIDTYEYKNALEILKLAQEDDFDIMLHGGSDTCTDDSNRYDMSFQRHKFISTVEKFRELGLNVRGSLWVGGGGYCTTNDGCDEFIEAYLEYGDAYSSCPQYSKTRSFRSWSTDDDFKELSDSDIEEINKIIDDKDYIIFCIHSYEKLRNHISAYISKIKELGGDVTTLGAVYDEFGSTKNEVELQSTITQLTTLATPKVKISADKDSPYIGQALALNLSYKNFCAPTYKWYANDSLISTKSTLTTTSNAAMTIKYKCLVEDEDYSLYSNELIIEWQAAPSEPVALLQSSDDTVVVNDSITLTVETIGCTYEKVVFNVNGVDLDEQTSNVLEYTLTENGSNEIYATVTTSDGIVLTSNVIKVIVSSTFNFTMNYVVNSYIPYTWESVDNASKYALTIMCYDANNNFVANGATDKECTTNSMSLDVTTLTTKPEIAYVVLECVAYDENENAIATATATLPVQRYTTTLTLDKDSYTTGDEVTVTINSNLCTFDLGTNNMIETLPDAYSIGTQLYGANLYNIVAKTTESTLTFTTTSEYSKYYAVAYYGTILKIVSINVTV